MFSHIHARRGLCDQSDPPGVRVAVHFVGHRENWILCKERTMPGLYSCQGAAGLVLNTRTRNLVLLHVFLVMLLAEVNSFAYYQTYAIFQSCQNPSRVRVALHTRRVFGLRHPSADLFMLETPGMTT